MKDKSKEKLSEWWSELKDLTHSEEIAQKLTENKDKIKNSLASIDGRRIYYRITHGIFHIFSLIARLADFVTGHILNLLGRLPLVNRIVDAIRGWKNHLDFRELIEFMRAKVYSLTHPPHDEKKIEIMEEVVNFTHRHGLDVNRHLPDVKTKLTEKKNQLLQHKFFQEFSKSNLERLLAIQFRFDRNIFPVLPDSAFWHKFFEYLERKKVQDIYVSGPGNEKLSLKKNSSKEMGYSTVIRMLNFLSEIKESGRRIFFIGHHEGYLGPYFVRSVIRKLGFDNLTGNCNTIVGPRMFSNLVLRNGAANVGNLFITVPSQKTTEIKATGLAGELRKTARRTLALIKMPDAVLDIIEKIKFDEFKKILSSLKSGSTESDNYLKDPDKQREFINYFNVPGIVESLSELVEEDYILFKNIMREPFLIFPEGSRSYKDPDGSVVMKYVSPKYFQAYMRPGDYIAPVNLVGGSDFTRGWHLSSASLGLSMAEPFEVTPEMIGNYEEEGIRVMKVIASLPNIKEVKFKDEIQYRDSK